MEWQLLVGFVLVFSNQTELFLVGQEWGDERYMHIVVTRLGFKAVQNAKLRVTKCLYYAAKVQHQDLEETVFCHVLCSWQQQ